MGQGIGTRIGCIAAIALFASIAGAQQSPTNPNPTPNNGNGGATGGTGSRVIVDSGMIPRGLRGRIQVQDGAAPVPDIGEITAPIDQGAAQPSAGSRSQVHVLSRPGGATQVGPTVGNKQGFTPFSDRMIPLSDIPDDGQPITLETAAAPLLVTDVLDDIALATGWNIIASPGVEKQTVRFWVKNVTASKVIEVLRFYGFHVEFNPQTDFLYVMQREEYLNRQYGAILADEFQVEHADVTDMQAILTSLLSPNGRLIPDPRTGTIFVWDTEDNLEVMGKAVQRLDVPLQPQVFTLKYLPADTLLDTVTALLSERGLAHVDPRANALVVTDLPARQGQIEEVVNALDVKLETRTWTLNYIEPDIAQERLEATLPEEANPLISIDEETHQISVTAIPDRLTEIDEIIAAWDVKGKQVLIEAFIISASVDVIRQFGIDWQYFTTISGSPFAIQSGPNIPNYRTTPEAGQRVSGGQAPYRQFVQEPFVGLIQEIEGQPGGSFGELVPDSFLLEPRFFGDTTTVVLNYLDSNGDISILSRPRVTVQDGEEAVFEATEDQPYQSVGFTTGGVVVNDGGNVTGGRVVPGQIQFIKVGTILSVIPRITEEDSIELEIAAEDSTAEDVTVVAADLISTVPQKRQNKAETVVLVNDGQTLVIGGLRSTTTTDDEERTPILGDIPFIGKLFNKYEKENRERELAIFITTTIVDENTMPEAARLAEYETNSADSMRKAQKSRWQRIEDKITGGANEIGVSIGQSGAIHSEGRMATIEDLRVRFIEASTSKPMPTVVIRIHSNAPAAVATEVSEAAMQAGLNVEFEATEPFVPNLPKGRQVLNEDGSPYPPE